MRKSVSRRLCFSAGHRLVGHEGGCRHVHGHNYQVEIHATAEHLDGVGRVIDFSVLKKLVGGWIDQNWDHAMILWKEDQIAELWEPDGWLAGHRYHLMDTNPTAENMAAYLLNNVCPSVLAGTDVAVFKVVVHETENCYAVAELEASA